MTRGRRTNERQKTPSMDAYGNVTLRMSIQMQFKSIHLFVCFVTKQRQSTCKRMDSQPRRKKGEYAGKIS